MKIAYLDCISGISGDMMLGALVDAGVKLAGIQAGIDSLGLPDCRLETEEVKKKGFRATKVNVVHEPEHAHRHLHHITDTPLGDDYNRFQEMTHWLRTGELPKGEELRCGLHHNLETAIQIGDEVAVAKWRVKLRQQAAKDEP